MDCRVSVVVGLGLLAGAAGCTPSALMSNSRETSRPLEVEPSAKVQRQQQSRAYVAFGDFRLREGDAPDKAEPDKRRMVEEARRAYRQALEIDRNCLEAHVGLARAFSVEGNHAQAIEAYQACLKTRPNDAVLWYELGMAHKRLKAWPEAVKALAKAVELDPDKRQYVYTLAYSLAGAGEYDRSLACLRHSANEGRAHYNLARILHGMQKDEVCRQHLYLALQADPTLKDAADFLVRLEGGEQSPNQLVPAQYQQQGR